LTAEVNLFNEAQMNEIPCHLCKGFPIEGLKAVGEKTRVWYEGLRGMEATTTRHSIGVEATLTAYESAPQWLGTESLIIAEGHGVVHDGDKNRPFLWTIPFYPRSIISSPESSEGSAPDLPSVYLDFLGEGDFPQSLFDAVADRLAGCVDIRFEEERPTLQNPESVMEMLLFFEYIYREGPSEGVRERLKQEIEESEGLTHYWTDWILAQDEDDRIACLEGFIEAVRGCWKIGQTYTFRIMREHQQEAQA